MRIAIATTMIVLLGCAPRGQSPPVTSPAAKVQSPWTDPSQAIERDGIRVSILEVVRGKVPLIQKIGRSGSESEESLLTIRLRLENTTTNKKVDYRGWITYQLHGPPTRLVDDVGNRYKAMSFGFGLEVAEAQPRESIYPGKSIEDAVVFEPPIDGAKFVRLTLGTEAFGGKGDLMWEIPAAMIQDR